MEKRNGKQERPRLRKEDIGTPVNFVHVKHVGFAQKSQTSQSASATPSFDNMDSFFNQENLRRSEAMAGNLKPPTNKGKENRLSNPLPPYSSLNNLTSIGSYNKDVDSEADFPKYGKQKSRKSISGSLLNLSFFPFSKSSGGEKSRGRKSDHESVKSKRLSLGLPLQNTSTYSFPFLSRSENSPPTSPPPPPLNEDSKLKIRRRSSSFNESDLHQVYSKSISKPLYPPVYTSLNRHETSKKPKMVTQLSLPLSPTYDDLPPPPPVDGTFTTSFDTRNLPESPSFVELPPPPPMRDIIPRKYSFSFGNSRHFPMPPPPPPPGLDSRRKLSAIPYTPPATPNEDFPPPPLPNSLPPSHLNSRNISLGKGRLIRVNAPTLPPLSVPFMFSKAQSPGTPNTWPLEPGVPELYYAESQVKPLPPFAEPERSDSPEEDQQLTIERMQKEFNTNSSDKCIDCSHIEPLTKLFQCRLSFKQWPKMMEKLFSNSPETINDPIFDRAYKDLIQNTLKVWLKSTGGSASLEDVVIAFEQTQQEISNDCEETIITKL